MTNHTGFQVGICALVQPVWSRILYRFMMIWMYLNLSKNFIQRFNPDSHGRVKSFSEMFIYIKLTDNLAGWSLWYLWESPMKNPLWTRYLQGIINFKVIPAGLEPTTTRTGIWHSIQLNYGTMKAWVWVCMWRCWVCARKFRKNLFFGRYVTTDKFFTFVHLLPGFRTNWITES